MESFFTAGAVLLWIIIGIIGLVITFCILSGIGYGILLFAGKIKRASRKYKINKRIHTKGGGGDG